VHAKWYVFHTSTCSEAGRSKLKREEIDKYLLASTFVKCSRPAQKREDIQSPVQFPSFFGVHLALDSKGSVRT
jgi:hypothetical protein